MYEPSPADPVTRLIWHDRGGARLSQVGDDAAYSNLELSPDGTQLAVGIFDPLTRARDLWIVDLKRNVRSRVTSDPLDERSAVWLPDGSGLVYRGRHRDLFLRSVGSGTERPLQVDGLSKDPQGFSPEGQFLGYRQSRGGQGSDIWMKPMQPEGEPRPLVATPFNENYAAVSPDGRWVAYMSSESGDSDVYVAAFPSGLGKARVSSRGGRMPRWRGDSRELYFLSNERALMAVAVHASGDTLDLGTPLELFQTDVDRSSGPQYIVTRDGQRFLVNTEVPSREPGMLSVVFNWRALLAGR